MHACASDRPPERVFLIGPMGAGKSAVGRRLARLLGYRFIDSDAEIEASTGVDIAFIFEKEGEAGFRRREREAIERLTREPGIVLATGGGAVLDPANRRCLAERGLSVYLATSLDQQLERTRHNRRRPLLETPDPQGRLAALAREREPLYQQLAAFTVSTDGRHVQAVAREIECLLQAQRGQEDRAGQADEGDPPG